MKIFPTDGIQIGQAKRIAYEETWKKAKFTNQILNVAMTTKNKGQNSM